jgi:hypothetical protein
LKTINRLNCTIVVEKSEATVQDKIPVGKKICGEENEKKTKRYVPLNNL